VSTVAVRERPILFSAPMVKAILEGRKTQTRRIVKPSNSTVLGRIPSAKADARDYFNGWVNLGFDDKRACSDGHDGFPYLHVPILNEDEGRFYRVYPRMQPGDRLWVRETWAMNDVKHGWCSIPKQRPRSFGGIVYQADGDGDWEDQFAELDGDIPPWKPSIFMPRWASRITLEITDVRVERVQDISREDVRGEGIPETYGEAVQLGLPGIDELDSHIWDNFTTAEQYAYLWDSLNGNWQENPWVWVVSFRRIEP
jgi:hypothetical protein